MFWRMLWPLLAPERAKANFQAREGAYLQQLQAQAAQGLPLGQYQAANASCMARQIFLSSMPEFGVGMLAIGALDRIIGKKAAGKKAAMPGGLGENLKKGFRNEIVVQMGVDLYRLSKLLAPEDFIDLEGLAERVEKRRMPEDFLCAWDAFVATHGSRGPLEMDVASPRYGEDPCLALRQMHPMQAAGEGCDPQVAHQQQLEERFHAYDSLLASLSWPRRLLLRRAHRLIDLYAGSRDTPKHHMVLAGYFLRQRLLVEARELMAEGRLDRASDIFHLTLEDLAAAESNPALDLRRIGRERSRFNRQLKEQVREFPQVIDSRGRILRPAARQEREGAKRGMGVSSGVVRGPVKVLHNPHEKTIQRGDILVAYTTDPGWTPLFVPAAAIILEVGGALQHGALVAREYGKPCVVGIERATQELHDGQEVEVDGTAGVIRLL
jgi:pyruvate,water dikinase